ncbi:MAG: hypothetical protein AAFX53_07995 [Bacteroidota bacterium]
MKEHLERTIKHQVEKKMTKAFKFFFAILAGIVLIFLLGYVTLWLWNWLIPYIFGLPTITYWQAVGILALAKILFGSFGGHHGHKGSKHKKVWKSGSCNNVKNDISKWKHYEKFWAEEGENAFNAYVERQNKTE